jgi:hypothetical protein
MICLMVRMSNGGGPHQRQQRIRWMVASSPQNETAPGMAFFQGLTHAEIADALKEPVGIG